jgi:hypothetical protein
MTLQGLMERVGSRKANVIRAYVDDGLRELEGLIPERTTYQKYSIVADQMLYDYPTNMIRLLGVYRKWSTSEDSYIRCGRVINLDLAQPLSSTATDNEQDIIVV